MEQGITTTCSGPLSSEWNIWIQLDELCYSSETRENSFARTMGDTALLPALGFCSIESATFSFRGAILEQSQHQEIVTYPKEAKGLVQQVTLYTPCEDAVADTFFGQGYCANPCPQTKLQGSLSCREQCIVCSDGTQVLDCSNIDATLVEDCDDESAFVRALLAFLKAETSGSLSAEPPTNNSTGESDPYDVLETIDTGVKDEQDEAPSVAAGEGQVTHEGSKNAPTSHPAGSKNTTGLPSSGAVSVTSAVHKLAVVLLYATWNHCVIL